GENTLVVRSIVKLIALSVVGLFASTVVMAAVPEPLRHVLTENGCKDLTDDPRITRFGDQWWVSLEPFTGGDFDFALYCEDSGGEPSARLILIVEGEPNP